jgi:hypothetical protein
MCLTVALDLVGEILEAPGLGLDDLALVGFDDLGGGGGQRIDLRLAQILACQENVLVKRHGGFLYLSNRLLADPRDCGAPPAFFDSPDEQGSGGP